jgi:glycosyltransferase domain-containing protein
MNNLLSKLTLVIPTYNRQSYALRNMHYWSGRGATVHVLDGSLTTISPSELIGLADNIHYHHLPVSFHERIKVAIELVATEYSATISDDEFYIPSALESCIEELGAQPDLVSCGGRVMAFDIASGELLGYQKYPQMENYAIYQNNSLERMVAHMDPYAPSTVYSVVRTPVWRRSMSAFVQKDFSLHSYEEFAFELSICCQGKSKVIPVLSWMRSQEEPSFGTTDIKYKAKVSLSKWLQDNKFNLERKEFYESLGSILADNQNQATEISKGVEKAMHVHANSTNAVFYLRYYISKLISKIGQYMPIKLRLMIKSMPVIGYFFPSFKIQIKPLLEAGKELANLGVTVDFKELSKIKLIVEEFHANIE